MWVDSFMSLDTKQLNMKEEIDSLLLKNSSKMNIYYNC